MNKPTWEITRDRPEGGFVLIRAEILFAAWWCYEQGSITLADLRLWFALQEVVARRCTLDPKRKALFTTSELMELTAQRRATQIRTSLGRLEDVGLAKARRSSIAFPHSIDALSLELPTDFKERLALIANHRRRVPVPRRILRWLAVGSRRVLIAATLGHLLRLLYLRNGRCRADGNCKASWLAAAFGINVRSAKQGRKRLIQCGVLSTLEIPQWYRNRYGWRGTINLTWAPHTTIHARSVKRPEPPLPSRKVGSKQAPPRQNRKLSPRSNNQKPANRPIGFCEKARSHLGRVELVELRNDQRTEQLLERAIQKKILGAGDRLNVFAAAEHALRVGSRNPAGLFVWLVANRRWEHITQADEDAAVRRLKRLDDCQAEMNLEKRKNRAKRLPVTDNHRHGGMTHIRSVIPKSLLPDRELGETALVQADRTDSDFRPVPFSDCSANPSFACGLDSIQSQAPSTTSLIASRWLKENRDEYPSRLSDFQARLIS